MPQTEVDEETERLRDLLQGFDTALLVTRTTDGDMRARPMAVAEAQEDGTLYFSTALDSLKVQELEREPGVAVCLQEGKRYVSITGTARILTDRALIDRLWSEAWKLWFPQGKGDPNICIIAIEPQEAEYWDRSGAKSLSFLFKAAKAYISGTRPSVDEPEEHGKVTKP
jgi:general stress protein 26